MQKKHKKSNFRKLYLKVKKVKFLLYFFEITVFIHFRESEYTFLVFLSYFRKSKGSKEKITLYLKEK